MSWHDNWFVLTTDPSPPDMPEEPDEESGGLNVTDDDFGEILVMSRLGPHYIPDVGGRFQPDLFYQKIHYRINNLPRALPAVRKLCVDVLVAGDL